MKKIVISFYFQKESRRNSSTKIDRTEMIIADIFDII